MYLAWKELTKNKRKFGLIIALVALITYLVYFLTALAYGLASSYTNGINKIGADYITMSDKANDNIMMSMLKDEDFNNTNVNGSKSKFGLFPAVIMNGDDVESKLDAYIFGVDDITFYVNDFKSKLEGKNVIVDNKLEKEGYKIGDAISLSNSEERWTIVGFTKNATYQTAPIVYISLDTWREYRFSGSESSTFNAIFIKGEVNDSNGLTVYKISDFNQTLPGYTAQVLTFTMMIGFLIVIIAFALGIFIYVLTIQKISMFGVMKAQGISNKYISLSVINQTILIVLIGTVFGLLLTVLTGAFLGSVIPFAINYLLYAIITICFFLFPILSGLFSVSMITKIDPLRAIG
ncbi:ABC transporter permease [Haploplasma axanthum]|uniref:FtsX-like permease family n=1 Tax=Haploplasma axanthum TaxID=29552 RepID=A0A449BBW9_HAPAX|nr:FtsX-like permease family protein [Haploplasma axanthum]VEU79922.1 FtsX-like permease family [Haploplasma axanthum]